MFPGSAYAVHSISIRRADKLGARVSLVVACRHVEPQAYLYGPCQTYYAIGWPVGETQHPRIGGPFFRVPNDIKRTVPQKATTHLCAPPCFTCLESLTDAFANGSKEELPKGNSWACAQCSSQGRPLLPPRSSHPPGLRKRAAAG